MAQLIVTFNARRLKLWNRVFDKVNFKTKQKQISLHRHFNSSVQFLCSEWLLLFHFPFICYFSL